MGCIYENQMNGSCQFAQDENGDYQKELEQQGSDKGFCVCSEDPDPGRTCESYESDWYCSECDTDLNVEECTCEDEDE